MGILPLMLFVSLLLGLIGLLAFIWAVTKNQFSDEVKAKNLALDDEDLDNEN